MFKRQIPLFIMILVGLVTLFGHFINNDSIQGFVNNDATQWFDIIASFAIFLGALNLLKLQIQKITRKQKNWQYSILAVLGFFFAIFAGFFFRGTNFVMINSFDVQNVTPISEFIATETGNEAITIESKLLDSSGEFEIPYIFKLESTAIEFSNSLIQLGAESTVDSKPWGAHLQTKGSLFYWIFTHIYTPLSATMFALLAFFVASASYRAFRIRNFEATLLLLAGIILMLGRVPIGQLISGWFIAYLLVLFSSMVMTPFISNKKIILGIVLVGISLVTVAGFLSGWQTNQPTFLYIPIIQEWIFNVPTTAGARAIMIGIALGIVGTSFRILIGIERSFLGE